MHRLLGPILGLSLCATAATTDILSRVERTYDVVVAGGGAGGASAALQARRMGATVALLAETNALGGQLLTVPTIDEGWMSRNFPSGIYGELVARIDRIYAAKTIAVGGCYWDAGARCYESHIVNQELTAMLRASGVDVYPRARVTDVAMDGNHVRGVEFQDAINASHVFASRILVDATEYGDIIPKTGAAHLVGNGTGDTPGTCIQNITYAAPIKYYDVVPPGLRITVPPPKYDLYKPEFAATVSTSPASAGYPVSFVYHNIYRAGPDLARGLSTAPSPPKSSINLANDYPDRYTYVKDRMPAQFFHLAMDTSFLVDGAARADAAGEAKLKTLAFLYYIQDPHGLNDTHWSIADDEFGAITTPADYSPSIPPYFQGIEAFMPPFPYVRESRRIQAMAILTAAGIRRTLGPDGRYRGPVAPTGIALGDYTTDFHGCDWEGTFETWANEHSSDLAMPHGPFQVPFEAFIPVAVDGFLAAEKNLGVSRVASSALRLQPAVMSTGQAVGAIAALAVRHQVEPRAVSPLETQIELAKAGARISMYAHDDVTFQKSYWTDVQVVGARGIMVGSSTSHFSAEEAVTRREAAVVLSRTLGYIPVGTSVPVVTAGTFLDVPSGDWGLAYVEAIAAHGITTGCSDQPRKFCPDDRVSRQQFAAFLARGAKLALGPAAGTGMFNDVDPGFRQYVEAAVNAGLMDPCSPGHFCGTAPATRAADVARGVRRTLSYLQVR